jgi:hypothetical protein
MKRTSLKNANTLAKIRNVPSFYLKDILAIIGTYFSHEICKSLIISLVEKSEKKERNFPFEGLKDVVFD